MENLFNTFFRKEIMILLHRGNTGDGLIQEGTRSLLHKCKIVYKEFFFPQDARGEILLISGCGSISHDWDSGIKYISRYIDYFDRIYILPSSFVIASTKIRGFLANLSKKIFIYCRERYSYDAVKNIAPFPQNIFLDKDMEFYMDHNMWKKDGRGILVAFRKDKEKNKNIKFRLIAMFHKLHTAFFINRKYIDVMQGSYKEWGTALEIISKFEKVYTDRVHVAIAAALLGKKTHIYPNANHIVRGVYENSLAHLPNVIWGGR
jgi:exopolysaccharide biosynthesis predicted pyruvyltransferase EpsI